MQGDEQHRTSSLPALGRGRGAGLSLGMPRGRGGGRGVARGNDQQPASSSSSSSTSSSSALLADAAIRSTDNDAVGSRIAAIQHHYLDADPYSLLLGPASAATARPPIINIGTYLRCRAIDSLVASFVEQGSGKKQIISLGAGSDSRYWRLHAQPATRARLRHYVELDFAELTTSKVAKVVRHQELLSAVASAEADVQICELDSDLLHWVRSLTSPLAAPDRASLQSASYSLLACDLRTLETCESVTRSLQGVLDPTLDTLILAECVLAYLPPTSSTSLLQHLAATLDRPYAICYEMCVAGDASGDAAEPSKFGAVMLNNLQARNLTMPGSRAYATLASHARRFEKTLGKGGSMGEGRGTARTLKQVWQDLDDAQRQRLSRLQGLDEVEELEILLSHYAVSWYASDVQAGRDFLSATL